MRGTERTSEVLKKEEIHCHLFLLSSPASPVSPIVLHHNGDCLIILKTPDYQSARFFKVRPQNRLNNTEQRGSSSERFGPLQIVKATALRTPPSLSIPFSKTTLEMRCCRGS